MCSLSLLPHSSMPSHTSQALVSIHVCPESWCTSWLIEMLLRWCNDNPLSLNQTCNSNLDPRDTEVNPTEHTSLFFQSVEEEISSLTKTNLTLISQAFSNTIIMAQYFPIQQKCDNLKMDYWIKYVLCIDNHNLIVVRYLFWSFSSSIN